MTEPKRLIAQYFGPVVGVNDWVDDNETRPLMLAARSGNIPLARALLDEGADIDARSMDSMTALSYAADHSHEQMIEFLVANGADLRDERAGLLALKRRDASAARCLSSLGYDWQQINTENELMIWAIEHGGGTWVVDFLANSGVDLNAACTQPGSWEGATPLTYCAFSLLDPSSDENNYVCVMLAAGADVSQLDGVALNEFYPEVGRVVESYRARSAIMGELNNLSRNDFFEDNSLMSGLRSSKRKSGFFPM